MSRTNTCNHCGKEVSDKDSTVKPDGNQICFPRCDVGYTPKTELFGMTASGQEITVTSDQLANIKDSLTSYLHKAKSNGMKRQNIIEHLTNDYEIPRGITGAQFWRVIKRTYIDDNPEIIISGNKRGTTYYLNEYFESTELSELTIPLMNKLRRIIPEYARFEKNKIPNFLPISFWAQKTRYKAEADVTSVLTLLLESDQLYKEGTGRGTRYFWSNDENPFQEAGPRERISIKLPAKMCEWLRSKSSGEGYRSQGEVIEQAMWEKYGKEISAWSDNFPL